MKKLSIAFKVDGVTTRVSIIVRESEVAQTIDFLIGKGHVITEYNVEDLFTPYNGDQGQHEKTMQACQDLMTYVIKGREFEDYLATLNGHESEPMKFVSNEDAIAQLEDHLGI